MHFLSSLVATLTLLGLLVASAHSATITYDGPTGGDWNTAANWSTGTLPTLADDVIIPTAKQVRVTSAISSTDALARSLSVQGTGQVVIIDNTLRVGSGGSVAGGVTGVDLAEHLAQWTGAATYSHCPPHTPQDLNHDCKVNGLDLALLLGMWG
jgi:hypothetical protein